MDLITLAFAIALIKGLPDSAAAQAGTYATAAVAAAERAAQYDHTLYLDELPGTTQTVTFDESGQIQQITHKRGNDVIRTDYFSFSENEIMEIRTLDTGEKLTIVTNRNTLETTVTYTA